MRRSASIRRRTLNRLWASSLEALAEGRKVLFFYSALRSRRLSGCAYRGAAGAATLGSCFVRSLCAPEVKAVAVVLRGGDHIEPRGFDNWGLQALTFAGLLVSGRSVVPGRSISSNSAVGTVLELVLKRAAQVRPR